MKTKEFYFDLPLEQIAQYPSESRGLSKLMVLDPISQKIYHETSINDLLKYIDTDTFLVFNNSKVRKSRIYAKTLTGGQVEFLILDRLDKDKFSAIVSRAKKRNVGKEYEFEDSFFAEIISKEDNEVVLKFDKEIDENYFEKYGLIPLPPYIKRDYDKEDEERYQTIYSKYIGSSAAATAGLHFSSELFLKLDELGISYDFVTLHVGLGTFLPVRSDRIEEHKMHFESFFIEESVAHRLENAKLNGKKILAVGTTSLRTLESAFDPNSAKLRVGMQQTDLFIYPGKNYEFKFVDMLFTNFHTPESTLLMLIAAFAGKDFVLSSYNKAIKRNYRFFSYGDSTLFLNHI